MTVRKHPHLPKSYRGSLNVVSSSMRKPNDSMTIPSRLE
jgi:hypothetical protein